MLRKLKAMLLQRASLLTLLIGSGFINFLQVGQNAEQKADLQQCGSGVYWKAQYDTLKIQCSQKDSTLEMLDKCYRVNVQALEQLQEDTVWQWYRQHHNRIKVKKCITKNNWK